MADEIQSGLGRTGRTFACEHDDVQPDVYILGKALGGGIVPLSAVMANWSVMSVLRPGEHGSTFGGNPLAAAIGREVVAMVKTGEYQQRARDLGRVLRTGLRSLDGIVAVRGRGLWAGIDLPQQGPTGRAFVETLLTRRVITKDTHGHTVRFAPPLTIEERDLHWGLEQIAEAAVHTRSVA